MVGCLHKLQKLDKYLCSKIKGQEAAIDAFSNVIRRALVLEGFKNRPKASILLLGPTGVGKTQTILETVLYLYEDPKLAYHRIDMSEYQHESSIKILLGENVEQQGILGDIIDKINVNSGGFLLFDEIEKAHPKLVSIFLQILDCGVITMANGTVKKLSNMVLVFTSNLGSADAAKMINSPYPTVKRHILCAAERFFSPELFARFNEIIVFMRLDYQAQLEICRNQILDELKRIQDLLNTHVNFSEDTVLYLLNKGFTQFHGARMLRNTIEKELGTLLVNWHLENLHQTSRNSLTLKAEEGSLKVF